MFKKIVFTLLKIMASLSLMTAASAAPLANESKIVAVPAVAAENFYGDVIKEIGGSNVSVISVITNAEQDPHHFEATPQTARQIAKAKLVVYNGADYDHWIEKLLKASPSKNRYEINVAKLINKTNQDNPHIWYLPATMPATANAIHQFFIKNDPKNKADYDQRLESFQKQLKAIDIKIAALRARYEGVTVTATEPVFDYMAHAIGLKILNTDLQRAIMNGTEPSAKDIAKFERDLAEKNVSALLYNPQVHGPLTKRFVSIAVKAKLPIVKVTETQPNDKNYSQWMMDQLNDLDNALQKKK